MCSKNTRYIYENSFVIHYYEYIPRKTKHINLRSKKIWKSMRKGNTTPIIKFERKMLAVRRQSLVCRMTLGLSICYWTCVSAAASS